MTASGVVALIGLGVAGLIVVAWLWTAWRMRRGPGLTQENPPKLDRTLFPWSGQNALVGPACDAGSG